MVQVRLGRKVPETQFQSIGGAGLCACQPSYTRTIGGLWRQVGHKVRLHSAHTRAGGMGYVAVHLLASVKF
jgi:hypothetical protein